MRLITRSDMDGLVCGMLIKELQMLDEILFVHPKDMQDGLIEVTSNDITTNLPFVKTAHLSFDHHESEMIRVGEKPANMIIDPKAASAARVVYDYYGGKEKFKTVSDELMEAVDKIDSADLTQDEVLNPTGWILLGYIMDARTGLGRFRDFRISNYELMMQLIDYCTTHSAQEVLELPDVKERVDMYFEHVRLQEKQVNKCAKVMGNILIIDSREEDVIYTGNRFKEYVMFPNCNVSIRIMKGKLGNTVLAIGKSIFNKENKNHVGEICLSYGGGGHIGAGTVQIENEKAQEVLKEIVEKLNK